MDHVTSIMNDLRWSDNDWLFSLRWVPARFLRSKINNDGQCTKEEAARYLAQR